MAQEHPITEGAATLSGLFGVFLKDRPSTARRFDDNLFEAWLDRLNIDPSEFDEDDWMAFFEEQGMSVQDAREAFEATSEWSDRNRNG